MDFTPPLPQPDPAPADPAQQRTERHLRMLAELGALGMDLARALHRRAMSEAAEVPAGAPSDATPHRAAPQADPALQFARIARAVRQTVALEARLAEDRDTQQERRQAEQGRQAAEAAREATAWRRKQIKRRILPAIKASKIEYSLDDLKEQLDDDAEDPNQLPLADAVARICRALRIDRDPIAARFGLDRTQGDDTAGPDESAATGSAAIAGAAIGNAATAPAASRPKGARVPFRPPASICPHLVDPLPPRGAVSGAGPP